MTSSKLKSKRKKRKKVRMKILKIILQGPREENVPILEKGLFISLLSSIIFLPFSFLLFVVVVPNPSLQLPAVMRFPSFLPLLSSLLISLFPYSLFLSFFSFFCLHILTLFQEEDLAMDTKASFNAHSKYWFLSSLSFTYTAFRV